MTQFDQRYQQVDTQYNAEHITIQQQPLSLTEKQRKQNRTRMLDRVQAIWIEGVLEPSIQGAAQIALELQHKPSAVVTPLWHVLREFSKTGPLLPADASIVQVYDHASGEVLILGEPGAGKTTLLLELTRDLLDRARQDEAHPIPVVFPLSSWATRRQPLTQWLASELHSRYQVPFPLATSWIETDQVLPLLDGLDEVAALHEAACVEAINTYRQAHGLLPTVICSRQTNYLALSTRLLLRTAVVVQPLTPAQIESYLASGGERLEVLRQTLRENADLQGLASTPLMLNVLTVAYQGTTHKVITTTGSLETKQEQIFATYVQRVLKRRGAETRYKPEQTIHWLSSLANQMKRQSQTIFYLEHLQPTWLSGARMPGVYTWLAVRLPGALMGALASLAIFEFLLGNNYYQSVFISTILLGGFLGGLLSEGSLPQRSIVSGVKARSPRRPRLLAWLFIGALVGLGIGLIFWKSNDTGDMPKYGLGYGLIFLLCSLLLQLLLCKSDAAQAHSQTPSPIEGTTWRRLIRRRAIHNGLLVGLLVVLSDGLGEELSDGLIYGLSHWLDYYTIAVLIRALSLGLNSGLSVGLSVGVLSTVFIGKSAAVQPTDLLVWSWRSLGKSLFSKALASATVVVIVLVGLINVLVYILTYLVKYMQEGGSSSINDLSTVLSYALSNNPNLGNWLSAGLGSGLLVGLSYWLLLGLFQGVSSATIEDQRRVVPNQGIRRSALNGLVLGLITTVIVGLLGCVSYVLSIGLSPGFSLAPSDVLSNGLSYGLSDGLTIGLVAGLSAGLFVGLLKGGLASFRHSVLRFLLWRTGSVPWHYAHFLDYAAERILLRKVGGGYIFVHRLLLDYFANLENGTSSDGSAEDRQERPASDTKPSKSAEPTGADEHSDVPTAPPAPPLILSEGSRLLPCGHEQSTPDARFCSVCGATISS